MVSLRHHAVLLVVLIALVCTGCVSKSRSPLEVYTPAATTLETRPMVVDFRVVDKRERISKITGTTLALLIPLWPYGSSIVQETFDKGASELDTDTEYGPLDEQVKEIYKEYFNRFGDPLGIVKALCWHMTESNLANEVENSWEESLSALSFENHVSPHADLVVEVDIIKTTRKSHITVYGLTVIGAGATALLFNGNKKEYEYEIHVSAYIPGNTDEALLRREFTWESTSPFYPFFGAFQASKKNEYDLSAVKVHEFCEQFVADLDAILPPSSNIVYWNHLKAAREKRIAAALEDNEAIVEEVANLDSVSPPAAIVTPTPTPQIARAWDVDASSMQEAASSGKRQLWAVVVGISKYQYAGKGGLSNLAYADKDARDFAAALEANGWPDWSINTLINEKATKREIQYALEGWLDKAEPDDLVMVYWSGHGIPDPVESTEIYFACYDTDPERLPTGYRMDRARLALEELRTRNVVVMLDACHAGNFLMKSEVKGIGRTLYEQVTEVRPLPPGWVFFASAESDRVAVESSSWSNGVFTRVLVDGLKGYADGYEGFGVADGIVTLRELRGYLLVEMPKQTQKVFGVDMYPLITTNSGDQTIWDLSLRQ